MLKRPNVFSWAKKELSQDAFICWLASWSNPQFEQEDKYMYSVGQTFLLELLKKHNIVSNKILEVEIFTQLSKIDIVIKLQTDTGNYVLVIEDKVHAGTYNPLVSYLKSVASDLRFENYLPLGLFIKTGDSSSYSDVTSKTYALFLKSDFIELFRLVEAFHGHNDIFEDFKVNIILKHIEVNSYLSSNIKDWTSQSWIGFYEAIKPETKFKNWFKVNNPSKGFLGSNTDGDAMLHIGGGQMIYLQIEQGNLCFKLGEIYGDKTSKKEVWEKWHSIIVASGLVSEINNIRRPSKRMPGCYMTIAYISRENWLGPDDSRLSMPLAIQKLNRYTDFLEKAVKDGLSPAA